MSLLTTLLISAALLFILGVASEFLARGAHIFEKIFGPTFTGSVILGFITMLPELIFVLVAVNAMEFEVALGSAIGGNILLFTIGYGLVIIIAWIRHKKPIKLSVYIRDDLWFLLIAAVYLLITSLKGHFALYDGIILTLLYVVFVFWQYYEVRYLIKEAKDKRVKPTRKEIITSIVLLVISGIIIIVTAEPFVHQITELSTELGISVLFLALVVSPFASELPEKLSAFRLAYNDISGAEISIANFVGSKVQAGTLLFGLMIIWKYILFGSAFLISSDNFIQLLIAIFTTIVGFYITYDLKLLKKEGIFVLVLYVIAIATTFYFLSTP